MEFTDSLKFIIKDWCMYTANSSKLFPYSKGVATNTMTVFFFVFLTHLNTDALYFRLNILF